MLRSLTRKLRIAGKTLLVCSAFAALGAGCYVTWKLLNPPQQEAPEEALVEGAGDLYMTGDAQKLSSLLKSRGIKVARGDVVSSFAPGTYTVVSFPNGMVINGTGRFEFTAPSIYVTPSSLEGPRAQRLFPEKEQGWSRLRVDLTKGSVLIHVPTLHEGSFFELAVGGQRFRSYGGILDADADAGEVRVVAGSVEVRPSWDAEPTQVLQESEAYHFADGSTRTLPELEFAALQIDATTVEARMFALDAQAARLKPMPTMTAQERAIARLAEAAAEEQEVTAAVIGTVEAPLSSQEALLNDAIRDTKANQKRMGQVYSLLSGQGVPSAKAPEAKAD